MVYHTNKAVKFFIIVFLIRSFLTIFAITINHNALDRSTEDKTFLREIKYVVYKISFLVFRFIKKFIHIATFFVE
jgi:hypothetical protein